jgi:hypothetical protein
MKSAPTILVISTDPSLLPTSPRQNLPLQRDPHIMNADANGGRPRSLLSTTAGRILAGPSDSADYMGCECSNPPDNFLLEYSKIIVP